jgi:hypothetical protein
MIGPKSSLSPNLSIRKPWRSDGAAKSSFLQLPCIAADDLAARSPCHSVFREWTHLLEPLQFFALQPSLLLRSWGNREDLSGELTASLTLLSSPQNQLPQECGLEVYGFTCTVASLVTNWIGLCCEFLAFTCTIDRVLAPGARALITMPMIVPVPLAPVVFG